MRRSEIYAKIISLMSQLWYWIEKLEMEDAEQ
jgi:hypothetical protein